MRRALGIGKVIWKLTVMVSALFGFLGLTGCGLAIFMNDEQWDTIGGDDHSDLAVLRRFSREKLNLTN